MNEFLRKFDTIRFVAPWSIFRNFLFFLIQIWILNLSRFGTGPNRNRATPIWPVTGQTRPVPTGFVNPACEAGDLMVLQCRLLLWKSPIGKPLQIVTAALLLICKAGWRLRANDRADYSTSSMCRNIGDSNTTAHSDYISAAVTKINTV